MNKLSLYCVSLVLLATAATVANAQSFQVQCSDNHDYSPCEPAQQQFRTGLQRSDSFQPALRDT